MITLVDALCYRALRYVHQPLGRFHVLVGPNASGKTTFLDVPAFLGALVSDGLEAAIGDRTKNFEDLVWRRKGRWFQLAVEARIPENRRETLERNNWDTIRYEVEIGTNPVGEVEIQAERAILKNAISEAPAQRTLFPDPPAAPESLLRPPRTRGSRVVVNKVIDGNDSFYPETGRGFTPSFKLGPRKSALGNLPEDESQFPVSSWLKSFLTNGIQQFVLNSQVIRRASPPGQVRGFKPDGSNLPWVVAELEKRSPERFRDWMAHLQTALPDLEDIRTVERLDDRHKYLVLRYRGALEVPSWMASDGTLRLLALTLPAYLPEFTGVYLIEEPENGIHPRAVQTMFQSLSSVYDAQILMATHSPVILSAVDARDVLCFAKTNDGATDIVSGSAHPALRDWKGETNLSVLFAAGVLG